MEQRGPIHGLVSASTLDESNLTIVHQAVGDVGPLLNVKQRVPSLVVMDHHGKIYGGREELEKEPCCHDLSELFVMTGKMENETRICDQNHNENYESGGEIMFRE